MAEQQREDTPKTGPAPKTGGATLPETTGRAPQRDTDRQKPGQGHEEIGQLPDTADFGPDDVKKRRG